MVNTLRVQLPNYTVCIFLCERNRRTAALNLTHYERYKELTKARSAIIRDVGVWSKLMRDPRSATRYAASEVLTLDDELA